MFSVGMPIAIIFGIAKWLKMVMKRGKYLMIIFCLVLVVVCFLWCVFVLLYSLLGG